MSTKAYRKAYPKEFRDKVVQLVQVSERSVREVAEDSIFRRTRYGAGCSRRSATKAPARTASAVRSGRNWSA